MGWVREVDDCIEAVTDEDCSLPKLRRTVVHSVDLKAIHVVGAALEVLKIVGKEAND
jgi:hypothetical protein